MWVHLKPLLGQKPTEVELPIEFSRANSEPLRAHFKKVCQLFVCMALSLPEGRRATMEAAMKGKRFMSCRRPSL
jgi:hypothetical protein